MLRALRARVTSQSLCCSGSGAQKLHPGLGGLMIGMAKRVINVLLQLYML